MTFNFYTDVVSHTILCCFSYLDVSK